MLMVISCWDVVFSVLGAVLVAICEWLMNRKEKKIESFWLYVDRDSSDTITEC